MSTGVMQSGSKLGLVPSAKQSHRPTTQRVSLHNGCNGTPRVTQQLAAVSNGSGAPGRTVGGKRQDHMRTQATNNRDSNRNYPGVPPPIWPSPSAPPQPAAEKDLKDLWANVDEQFPEIPPSGFWPYAPPAPAEQKNDAPANPHPIGAAQWPFGKWNKYVADPAQGGTADKPRVAELEEKKPDRQVGGLFGGWGKLNIDPNAGRYPQTLEAPMADKDKYPGSSPRGVDDKTLKGWEDKYPGFGSSAGGSAKASVGAAPVDERTRKQWEEKYPSVPAAGQVADAGASGFKPRTLKKDEPEAEARKWYDPRELLSQIAKVGLVQAKLPGSLRPRVLSLIDAARFGDVQTARNLLAKDPESVNKGDAEMRTPLHIASAYSRSEIAVILIQGGAQVDATDAQLNTPLHYAAGYGRPELVAILTDAKANPAVKNNVGKTPIDLVKSAPSNPLNTMPDVMSRLSPKKAWRLW